MSKKQLCHITLEDGGAGQISLCNKQAALSLAKGRTVLGMLNYFKERDIKGYYICDDCIDKAFLEEKVYDSHSRF